MLFKYDKFVWSNKVLTEITHAKTYVLCYTGNTDIAWLTNQTGYTMRIDLLDWSGNTRYAEYGTFTVGPASDGYRLDVAEYTGDAGRYYAMNFVSMELMLL
jgi:hypothetical protein